MADGDLTDLASVKAWLGLPAEAGANDALLAALISAASDFVVGHLNGNLLSADYVEVQDGNGSAWMLLRQAPITRVASVSFAGVTLTAAADPVAGVPGLMFDGRRLSLLGYRFPYGAPVVVSYTAGYASPPPAIRQAVNELVGEAFRRRDRIGQTSRTLGGQETVAFQTSDMNAAIQAMLAPYQAVVPV
jgi:hypothetical protein